MYNCLIQHVFGCICSLLIPESVSEILQARTLQWVAISFSRGYSQPRDQTQVSCIAGRFYTIWATSESENRSVVSNSLRPHGLYNPWKSPSQNTGVGSLFLLQGIFPTQESNPSPPHCRQILYQLSHKGSPREARSLSLHERILKLLKFWC